MTLDTELAYKLSQLPYYHLDDPIQKAQFNQELQNIGGGWQLFDKIDTSDGYRGMAFVKIENGIPVDFIVSHAGTEFTGNFDYRDILTDTSIAGQTTQNFGSAFANSVDQVVDAVNFNDKVTLEFSQLYPTISPYSMLTQVGHSLGAYLAGNVANAIGDVGKAIIFDGPKLGFFSTLANIFAVNNGPNFINTAGSGINGTTVADIGYGGFLADLIHPDFGIQSDIVGVFDLVFFESPSKIVGFINAFTGGLFAVPLFTAVFPLVVLQDIHDHLNMAERLANAHLSANSVYHATNDYGAENFLIGDYRTTGQLGGVAKILWDSNY